MQVGQYELDERLLTYWAIVIVVLGLVLGALILNLQEPGETRETKGLEIIPEEEPLIPGQVSKLKVVEDEEEVEGAEVRLEGLYIGDTNSKGVISFEALDKDFRINASINDTEASTLIPVDEESEPDENPGFDDSKPSNESKEDGKEDEAFTGFRFEEDPVAGETARLELYRDDELQPREEFTVNGEEAETTIGGSYTFTVPNTETLELEASEISDSFEVEGYEEDDSGEISGDIDPSFERSGPEYAGETVTFDASETESENPVEEYRWTFDHEDFNDTLEGEEVEYEIPEEGPYDIDLEVEDSEGFTETDTDYMKADPEYEGAEITLTGPSDGDTVEAEEDFEFQVENARRGQTAYVMVEGREEASTRLEPGLNIIEGDDALTTPISEEGVQDYRIEVRDEGGTWDSSEREIENTRAYDDFGSFSVERPEDGAEIDGNVTFEADFDLKTNVELTVSGQETGEEEDPESFSFEEPISESDESISFEEEVNASEYEWQASIAVPDTTESENADERNLTVN
ncbi:MAG: PKD domain-containing protein [Candidatus Nanohaloarchaea archaeon]